MRLCGRKKKLFFKIAHLKILNFANFFRQAMLRRSSKRPHLEDSLALYGTAKPKQLCFHECSKQDSDVILTPFNPHNASYLFQYPLKT